ncbi:type II secretion system F family protein [Yersinia ruckeri]|uniref:type II secretion system F family protein n=1 Tax=Yersinia ruckeri TaxID=29486 RepID=UPI0020C03C6E|nr:type II secretion system F family protein [Yersinia ruckeri]MCK8585707.1 type II secretion system F family protein [Yersinia ruckeri]MCW6539450.1 type II secretion system F family protein [Yersinia ruckeri]MCW6638732.1 type II secretion system F family protein [Yersinia ruckeri]UZX65830.1 type II secretion system F family protein [Yersinia ruckeri]UZX69034.1 type II secretion system F family protein [Yersinia ruckeri]
MATFRYRALTKEGKKYNGMIKAENIVNARREIRVMNLILLKIHMVKKNKNNKRISKSELITFTRQLATLISSSIAIDEALDTIANQTDNKSVLNIIFKIKEKITSGHSLSESIMLFPRAFNILYHSMITAGETSGHLGVTLHRLADNIEETQRVKNKLVQSLIYPCALLLVSIGVISILLSVVVPKVLEQFIYMGQELPFSTKLLLSISDFIKNYGLLLLFSILLTFIFSVFCFKNKEVKIKMHKLILSLPIIGGVISGVNSARYARTLSTLNSSGVPLLQSMIISLSVLTNNHLKYKVECATELVSEGRSLSFALAQVDIFSPLTRHMISAGEKSGELNAMLEKTAEIQEEELIQLISVVINIIEPTVIVIMASFVFFIVLSILQPILLLNNSI